MLIGLGTGPLCPADSHRGRHRNISSRVEVLTLKSYLHRGLILPRKDATVQPGGHRRDGEGSAQHKLGKPHSSLKLLSPSFSSVVPEVGNEKLQVPREEPSLRRDEAARCGELTRGKGRRHQIAQCTPSLAKHHIGGHQLCETRQHLW